MRVVENQPQVVHSKRFADQDIDSSKSTIMVLQRVNGFDAAAGNLSQVNMDCTHNYSGLPTDSSHRNTDLQCMHAQTKMAWHVCGQPM